MKSLVEQLQSELAQRKVVERAKGIMMRRNPEMTGEAALGRLQQLAAQRGCSLHKIAETVVTGDALINRSDARKKSGEANRAAPVLHRPSQRNRHLSAPPV